MRQWTKLCDKEEAELLRQLVDRREKATEKYLSHFTVHHHQKIIRQGDIDMKSRLPSLQAPDVSALDLSLMAFMEQQGDQLKQYVDRSVKRCMRSYEKSTSPSFPSHESNAEPPMPNIPATYGSPLAQPSYGMPMHMFV
jgi:hypothetical protein